MASAKQLTGGTNDVNPQWWNLGRLDFDPLQPEHSEFNYWFYDYDGVSCLQPFWQTGRYHDEYPPPVLPSGFAVCANAASSFPVLPYNYKWRQMTKAYSMSLNRFAHTRRR